MTPEERKLVLDCRQKVADKHHFSSWELLLKSEGLGIPTEAISLDFAREYAASKAKEEAIALYELYKNKS